MTNYTQEQAKEYTRGYASMINYIVNGIPFIASFQGEKSPELLEAYANGMRVAALSQVKEEKEPTYNKRFFCYWD